MGLFKKKKTDNVSELFKLVNPLGKHEAGTMLKVTLYEDHLTADAMLIKQEVSLDYSQITDVFYGYQTEMTEVNKSVIGRAVAGGLLFGGVGAVVGAVSGSGTKEKKKTHLNFIISYKSSSGTDEFLLFEDSRLTGRKLADKLKELCNISSNDTGSIKL